MDRWYRIRHGVDKPPPALPGFERGQMISADWIRNKFSTGVVFTQPHHRIVVSDETTPSTSTQH